MKNYTAAIGPCKILFLENREEDVGLMLHEIKKDGLKNIFRRVSTKKDFLDALEDFCPDIIISDYALPMFNGMHAFRLLREKNNSIPFILVTGTLTEELALECMHEGVDDFVLKSNLRRLPAVIVRHLEISMVLKEKQKISAELENKNEELKSLKSQNELAKIHELLSRREFEILVLIACGNSVKEIAGQLSISPATVATYRARILTKLVLKSNVELTKYAIQNKLID
jgi:DNA-binding NarL/FixJ family response regulator